MRTTAQLFLPIFNAGSPLCRAGAIFSDSPAAVLCGDPVDQGYGRSSFALVACMAGRPRGRPFGGSRADEKRFQFSSVGEAEAFLRESLRHIVDEYFGGYASRVSASLALKSTPFKLKTGDVISGYQLMKIALRVERPEMGVSAAMREIGGHSAIFALMREKYLGYTEPLPASRKGRGDGMITNGNARRARATYAVVELDAVLERRPDGAMTPEESRRLLGKDGSRRLSGALDNLVRLGLEGDASRIGHLEDFLPREYAISVGREMTGYEFMNAVALIHRRGMPLQDAVEAMGGYPGIAWLLMAMDRESGEKGGAPVGG
jgi:hypothetical protein